MARTIIKNFSWVLFAQIIVLVISVARAIIVPKYLSVDDFGYWEIYWFYTCYTAICCFGYNDGLYLRYGGHDIDKLPERLIRSANLLLISFLSVITIIACVVLHHFRADNPDTFPFTFVLLNVPIVCLTGICIYLYQITGNFKEYTLFSTLDKLLVIIVIILLVLFQDMNYKVIVVTDFVGRIIVLGIMTFKLRRFVFGPPVALRNAIGFLWTNISCGIKLMIANLMGMLLIGGGKMIVQALGGVRDFAIYSFGFSITGLIMTGVSAVSLVLYPSIKRQDERLYPGLFMDVNAFTRFIGLSSLLLYYPCYLFLEWFYPQYVSILPYLNYFFIIVYANIKISVLTNTFFNATRRETTLLKINIGFVILFLVIATALFSWIRSISIIALLTGLTLVLRSLSSEILISNKLGVMEKKHIAEEVLFLVCFWIVSSYLPFTIGLLLLIGAYALWNVWNRKQTKAFIFKLFK